MYEIKAEQTFSAAHHLLEYEGECEHQHGHNWKVEVFAKGGAFLGTGVINRNSKITVRLIGSEHADQILADTQAFYNKKIQDAYDLRKLHRKNNLGYLSLQLA